MNNAADRLFKVLGSGFWVQRLINRRQISEVIGQKSDVRKQKSGVG
jgi:hypothetical protein